MKSNHFFAVLASAVLLAPLGVSAQTAPQGTVVGATAPGKAVLGASVQLQGKIKSIDKQARVVVVVGPKGNDVVFNLGPDVRNFDQLQVGDLVTLNYAQAVLLELRKVKNTGIRERDESEQATRAKAGEKPGGSVQKTVRMIADVIAVNDKTQTITLRGAEHTAELKVKNPDQLKEIKVGDQVEAKYIEAVALQVTAAK